jgi:pSer/pThr/pTyr-binding forkhead associated (FHA) protein
LPYIEIHSPEGRKLLRLPDGQITIGRSSQATVVINDDYSSRIHCNIQRTSGGYVLTDQGSRNGTKVDGVPIQEMPLTNGSEFWIGRTRFRFTVVDPRQQRATASSIAPASPAAR